MDVDDAKPGAARERSLREVPPLLSIDPTGRWIALVHAGELRLLPFTPAPAAAAEAPPLSTSAIECARFSRTGELLLSGGGDKQVRLWDTATRECTRSWMHGKKIACVEFSPDAGVAMWADRFGEVYVVSLREADAAPSLALGHLSPVSHLRLSPCGTALLSADREGHVRNSAWPNPFVIANYYLAHTLPLQTVLPLVRRPRPASVALRPSPYHRAPARAAHPTTRPHPPPRQAAAPLLFTSANAGRDLCLWRRAPAPRPPPPPRA